MIIKGLTKEIKDELINVKNNPSTYIFTNMRVLENEIKQIDFIKKASEHKENKKYLYVRKKVWCTFNEEQTPCYINNNEYVPSKIKNAIEISHPTKGTAYKLSPDRLDDYATGFSGRKKEGEFTDIKIKIDFAGNYFLELNGTTTQAKHYIVNKNKCWKTKKDTICYTPNIQSRHIITE